MVQRFVSERTGNDVLKFDENGKPKDGFKAYVITLINLRACALFLCRLSNMRDKWDWI